MDKILFSKPNFEIVYKLLIASILQQKGINIQGRFQEDIKNTFIEIYKINRVKIQNDLQNKIDRRKIVLDFNKSVLNTTINKISRIIDDQISYIEKQKFNNFEISEMQKQAEAINHSGEIPTQQDHLRPRQQEKNTPALQKDYESFMKSREMEYKPPNEIFNSNSLSPFDSFGGQENTVNFKNSPKKFSDTNDIENLLSQQMNLREPSEIQDKITGDEIHEMLREEPEEKPEVKESKKLFLDLEGVNPGIHAVNSFVGGIEIESIEFTANKNNITVNNNKFLFKEDEHQEDFFKVELETGVFSIDEITNNLRMKMEEIGNCKYSVSFNSNTQKVVIKCLGVESLTKSKYIKKHTIENHCFSLKFEGSSNKLLGFNKKEYSGELEYISEKKYHITPEKLVFLHIPEIQDEPLCKIVIDPNTDFISKDVNFKSSVMTYISELSFEFRDSNNCLYDFDYENNYISLIIK